MGHTAYTAIRGGCLAAAALFSGHALAADAADDNTAVLQPSTKWRLEYADEKCRLARVFGAGDDRVLIAIEQYGPSDSFNMSIAGSPVNAASQARELKLLFGALPVENSQYIGGWVQGYGRALFFTHVQLAPVADPQQGVFDWGQISYTLPRLNSAAAAQATMIALKHRRGQVTLQTGALSEPMEALNQCTFDLLGHWGLDAERHKTLTRMPHWTNREAVVKNIAAAYPAGALSAGRQAVFAMRVLIDEAGKVTGCTLLDATINKSLESPACTAMRAALFTPALDQAGAAMPSYYLTSVSYQIG